MKIRLEFPHRGSPPPVPEGYERDSGDPFIFNLKWRPCIYHGIDNGHHTCVMYLKVINQHDCQKCTICCEPSACHSR